MSESELTYCSWKKCHDESDIIYTANINKQINFCWKHWSIFCELSEKRQDTILKGMNAKVRRSTPFKVESLPYDMFDIDMPDLTPKPNKLLVIPVESNDI